MEHEEVMMMMMINNPQNPRNEATCEEPISAATTDCPIWKLYENPCFSSQAPNQQCHNQSSKSHLHRLQLPLSARKIASCNFWDLSFRTELDLARAHIAELKAELERERKARKKVESINRRLVKEVAEERRGREAMERFAGEISNGKAEIGRKRREMEEERKMMKVAEVLREERVQMKLTEAKNLLEEKISALEGSKTAKTEYKPEQSNREDSVQPPPPKLLCRDSSRTVSPAASHRRASPEAENPHIKRGIKGFVEFPRVVRAIGAKSRHWGSKLECQQAQLRILLKQRSSIGSSNNLIIS